MSAARRAAQPARTASSLDEHERRQVAERSAPRAVVVFETVRREGENELERPVLSLAASGLAAGLSMGFSLVATGILRALLPDASWRPLVENFGYTIGFLIVVMGRQQLFTENTLTVVLPFLDGPNKGELAIKLLRVWSIVLIANLVGALLFALVASHSAIFADPVRHAFGQIGTEAASPAVPVLFLRGIIAAWLIALMVWVLPAAESARPWMIVAITYVVGVASLAHVVAGSVEVLYAVCAGLVSWSQYLVAYLVPVLAGNIVGGVALVALLNYAQVVAERKPARSRR